jgi:hypothetical protein
MGKIVSCVSGDKTEFFLGIPLGVLDAECEDSRTFRNTGQLFTQRHGAASNKTSSQFSMHNSPVTSI